jgi:hypothetical protein
MDIDKILFDSLLMDELARFPDVKLYNASAKLTPEERPTVPVRLGDKDWNIRPTNAWVDQREPGVIYVNKNAPIYQKGNLPRIAASLAHEALHANGADLTEQKPYEREAAVLKRLDPKGSKKRIADIAVLIEQFRRLQK